MLPWDDDAADRFDSLKSLRQQVGSRDLKIACIRLVHDDGAEVLFAATRELLIQLTSRSLHGEFVLPAVSFTDVKPTIEQRANRGASSDPGAILAAAPDVPPVSGDEK